MKREKLLKWFAAFFAAMLVFTFLSKAADSVSVAKVLASAPQNQLISHTVSGTGKIESTKETAVFVQEGIKIAQVHVKAGEAVKKGQPLMTLLESSIQESIDKKKDEIQEASLKISDIQSQKNIDAQKRENSSRWAQQDLDTALGNGDINISNAQNELNIAQQRLAEYRQKKQRLRSSRNWSSSPRDRILETGERDRLIFQTEAIFLRSPLFPKRIHRSRLLQMMSGQKQRR